MAQQIDNRDNTIDTLKGALIFLVVMAHILGGGVEHEQVKYIYDFIYTFHMPAFVLISGFLSKGCSNLDIYKLSKHILVPFIVFNFIYEFINFLLTGSISGYLKIGAPYWIMWYLLSLFFWQIIASVLFTFRYPLCLSLLISFAFQFIDFSSQTLSIMRTINFLPYFIIGALFYRNNLLRKKHDKNTIYLILFSAVIALVILSILAPTIFLYGAFPFSYFDKSIVVLMLYKVVNYAAVPAFVLALMQLKPTCVILERFGKNSLSIYLLHGLFILYISTYLNKMLSWPFILVGTVIISFAICYLLSSAISSRIMDRLFSHIQSILLSKASQ